LYIFPFAVHELQDLLLRAAGLPVFRLPARGTVSATALDLALGITNGKVYVCGMDFAMRDIQTHARPYVFDTMIYEKSRRVSPWYTRRFERALGIRDGGSLNVYAHWFKRYAGEWRERLFPFAAFDGHLRECEERPVWRKEKAAYPLTRHECARVLCKHIVNNPGGGVHKEVSELLFDSEEIHGIEEIERLIVSLA
jgi:hypothetical protein